MFQRVLIANRGVIARRIVRALNSLGIESVVVYSEADQGAPYLAEATQAIALKGVSAAESYLNVDVLEGVIRKTGADAVHPGYGFLAENAGFARRVAACGARFIGPAPDLIEQMGDKVCARQLAVEHNFPCHAGSALIASQDEALTEAARIGYPVMVKPAAGGGGIGMQVADSDASLRQAFSRAGVMAERAFGSAAVYLERWIENPRHIEVQVLGDGKDAMHLYERECSVQRRHQKVIEESPAPGIDRAELEPVLNRARQFSADIGYDSVGTIETLRGADGAYGFLEMNTRIQVEHGVTEMVTGVDLVSAQIALAAGLGLPKTKPLVGHALEVRVYAEDSRTLMPSTGQLSCFRPPQLHGVRVETGMAQGQFVTQHYDPMLAKLISVGHTREMAIGRALVACRAFEIRGVNTNLALLQKILTDPVFIAGNIDTGYLDRLLAKT
ncbi:MAG: ATP-grasp domain-containing protein [Proteobacteria bacterium]|nr:ATP-grasp domain-containing protein [Pseudomonadota bacterium]